MNKQPSINANLKLNNLYTVDLPPKPLKKAIVKDKLSKPLFSNEKIVGVVTVQRVHSALNFSMTV